MIVIVTKGMIYYPTHQTKILSIAKRIWDGLTPIGPWMQLQEWDMFKGFGPVLWQWEVCK